MKAIQNKFFFPLLLVVVALGLAAINFRYGYFEDSDVMILLERAWKFPSLGWGPSRNWGYPLYEFPIYPILVYLGLGWAKVYSLLFYVASVLLFYFLVFHFSREPVVAFLGALSFLVNPLEVISGNSVTETSQGIFFAVAALLFFFRFLEKGGLYLLLLTALFCGLATATRQDYVVFSASLALTLLVFRRPARGEILLGLAVYLGAGLGPYLLFYGASHFRHLDTGFLGNDSVSRKFLRSLLGYLAIIGIPCFLFALYHSVGRLKRIKDFRTWVLSHPAVFLFFCGWSLYFVRYVLLDTKLEYVSAILLFFILLVFVSVRKKSALALFVLAMFLPNVLQIHFFRRAETAIRFDPGFSRGAILQDRSGRLKQSYIFFGDYYATLEAVARKQFGCEKVASYLAEWVEPDLCVIVPIERLRYWNSNRLRKGMLGRDQLFQKKVIVFPFPDNRGWRQFFGFSAWQPLNPSMFHLFSSAEP